MSAVDDKKTNEWALIGYAPGILVRHPDAADWGVGQVQSAIGNRVTVNFQHAGKKMIDVSVIGLEVVDAAER
jgi:hypothetical protein